MEYECIISVKNTLGKLNFYIKTKVRTRMHKNLSLEIFYRVNNRKFYENNFL
jgi:hypothetical protein